MTNEEINKKIQFISSKLLKYQAKTSNKTCFSMSIRA